jgi:hypothetical protein
MLPWIEMDETARMKWLCTMTGKTAQEIEAALAAGQTQFCSPNSNTHAFDITGEGAWVPSDAAAQQADPEPDADGPAAASYNGQVIGEMSKADLVKACKAEGLPSDGAKPRLIERLTAHVEV